MKLIIDGNNLAYRANCTTNLYTKTGERVSAIYGTLQMIQSYLKKAGSGWKNKLLLEVQDYKLDRTLMFDEVIMCWDGGKSKFRKAIFADYKGHRERKRSEKTKEEQEEYYQFLDQMSQLHDILPSFGVKSLKIKDWEGDDLIYAVVKYSDPDELKVIVSTDRDMLQLVSENVLVWSPFKEVLVTPKNFVDFTGVPQSSYLTFRVLVGDATDNIEGIKGIGEKKAKDLILKYGDLNGILANQAQLMKSVVTRRIFENYSLVERNQKLMDMRRIPVEEIAEEVKEFLDTKVEFSEPLAKAFLMSKQFVSILKDFGTWSIPFKHLKY